MIEVVIPGDAAELSPNRRLHWRTYANLKKKWRTSARLVGQNLWGGKEPLDGLMQVSYIIRRARRLDPDNAASSGALKHILDGLVDAGLLVGDTAKHTIRGEVRQETGKQYKGKEEVVVIISPAGSGAVETLARGP